MKEITNHSNDQIIFELLRNEKYTGVYIYNKASSKDANGKRNTHLYKDESEIIRVEGGIPAIVSKEDFNTVQSKMLQRKHQSASYTAKETYLLSGKVFCGVCGAPYNGNSRTTKKTNKLYVDYRCSKRGGKSICTNKGIRRDDLDAYVIDRLADFVFDDAQIPYLASNYKQYLINRDTVTYSKKKEVEAHIRELQKDIDLLLPYWLKQPLMHCSNISKCLRMIKGALKQT